MLVSLKKKHERRCLNFKLQGVVHFIGGTQNLRSNLKHRVFLGKASVTSAGSTSRSSHPGPGAMRTQLAKFVASTISVAGCGSWCTRTRWNRPPPGVVENSAGMESGTACGSGREGGGGDGGERSVSSLSSVRRAEDSSTSRLMLGLVAASGRRIRRWRCCVSGCVARPEGAGQR